MITVALWWEADENFSRELSILMERVYGRGGRI